MNADASKAARERIATAFSPHLLEQLGIRLAAMVADHFRRVQADETAVLNWRLPAEYVAEAEGWMHHEGAGAGT